jgi:DNA-binding NarL/FixJ family response regulator
MDADPVSIVIVDDHPLYRRGVRTALESQPDLRVAAEVGSVAEALATCDRLRPDVVVVDINLPDGSGVDAARALKARQPDVALLILTAYDDASYVGAVADAGARGYLLKSASDAEIIGAVRTVATGGSVFAAEVVGALLRRERGEGPGPFETLTGRELEVLQLVAAGRTNREIGATLQISERTAQAHLSHIFDKLGTSSRTEAVTVALRHGLIALGDAGGEGS